MKKAGKVPPKKKEVQLGAYLPQFRAKMCGNSSVEQCGAL
jgi:hypothetical protein